MPRLRHEHVFEFEPFEEEGGRYRPFRKLASNDSSPLAHFVHRVRHRFRTFGRKGFQSAFSISQEFAAVRFPCRDSAGDAKDFQGASRTFGALQTSGNGFHIGEKRVGFGIGLDSDFERRLEETVPEQFAHGPGFIPNVTAVPKIGETPQPVRCDLLNRLVAPAGGFGQGLTTVLAAMYCRKSPFPPVHAVEKRSHVERVDGFSVCD